MLILLYRQKMLKVVPLILTKLFDIQQQRTSIYKKKGCIGDIYFYKDYNIK